MTSRITASNPLQGLLWRNIFVFEVAVQTIKGVVGKVPLFGPPGGEGPIRCPLSVCQYVCDSRPALTTPTIFLIFGMKVGDH